MNIASPLKLAEAPCFLAGMLVRRRWALAPITADRRLVTGVGGLSILALFGNPLGSLYA